LAEGKSNRRPPTTLTRKYTTDPNSPANPAAGVSPGDDVCGEDGPVKTYYDVRLDEQSVNLMKAAARRRAFSDGLDNYSWVNVLRRGVELVLAEEAALHGPLAGTTNNDH
jgi:hypothetical protein